MALAEVFERVAGPDAPVEFRAYDGSVAGTGDAPIRVMIKSPVAVAYLAQAPGTLGLARAYVSGHLDVEGDMYTALARMVAAQQIQMDFSERLRLLRELGGPKTLLPRVPPPPQEVKVSRRWLAGRRHSKNRDASAISHHYDVSNTFYEWVLGPSMAYTCAVYPSADASLEEAQAYKHDLIAKKLGLRSGMRLLDVGCGWGGMVRHAAREYGVKAIGVTLSAQQAAWAQKAIEDQGLSGLAEVRHLDYRDVPETGFDAVSSIGLTEHIGKAQLPGYFSFLQGKLRPEGRLLNHCITRPDNTQPARQAGGFINRYVFPDGELEGPGYLVSLMNDAGFEVRHEENLREHYAMTLAGWCANLDAHWKEAVAEVGPGAARVWRLYMAGSRLGFDRNQIQLHQVLGTKLTAEGASGMPLRPTWPDRPAAWDQSSAEPSARPGPADGSTGDGTAPPAHDSAMALAVGLELPGDPRGLQAWREQSRVHVRRDAFDEPVWHLSCRGPRGHDRLRTGHGPVPPDVHRFRVAGALQDSARQGARCEQGAEGRGLVFVPYRRRPADRPGTHLRAGTQDWHATGGRRRHEGGVPRADHDQVCAVAGQPQCFPEVHRRGELRTQQGREVVLRRQLARRNR